MVTKILYLALSVGSLGLLAFEAPGGGLLTGKPEVGKVEHQSATGTTIRTPHYVFLGGFHGGK